MRTTVELDEDTAKAVERLRRERGVGVSEAVNELIRRGLMSRSTPGRFTQWTRPVGLKIGVTNVAWAVDLLEGDVRRA